MCGFAFCAKSDTELRIRVQYPKLPISQRKEPKERDEKREKKERRHR